MQLGHVRACHTDFMAGALSETRRYAVSVTTAHKILITAAVLLFFGYAVWELRQYARLGDIGALLRCAAALLGAIGFGIYLRSFVRSTRG